MSRLLLKPCSIVILFLTCGLLADAQDDPPAQPLDSVSGKMKADGNAGSGKLKVDVSVTTSALSDVKCEYFQWNGNAWQNTGQSHQVNALKGTFNFSFPTFQATSGTFYYGKLSIFRGNPPAEIATSNTNSLAAP
jgi:hypothetical protein